MPDRTAPRRPGRPPGLQGEDLLAVARRTFLELGLGGTTVSEIAARAGISKASLYREHKSKNTLFAAVVLDWTARGRDAMRPALDALLEADDVHEGLLELALVIQAGVLDDDVVRMRRLIASEADRFPHVAASYVAESWDRNIAALADTLTVLHRRGALDVSAALPAAEQFTWLAVAGPLNQRTLGVAIIPPDALARTALEAAATFLARYAIRDRTGDQR